ncbi:hypothetical protein DERF_002811 [Dermatophagoides farinae]|uniref:Uncharacterized protein n=1 Tax=Dermatophagoides farinae TaxID=6954 RepID=A0A922ICD6_DERFA|nr:hypothetical protein DERF_002811 [Dermatophagoides farinae]
MEHWTVVNTIIKQKLTQQQRIQPTIIISNHSFNQSTNLRENYLNFSTSTETNTNNNNCNNRPPAIRSNSSASSLYPSLNSNNNNIQPSPNSSSSPTKSFTGNVCDDDYDDRNRCLLLIDGVLLPYRNNKQ